MKAKINDTPFWAKEHELMEARSNLERGCYYAENLYDAVLCGANMTHLDDEEVGYIDEDGTLELYDEFEDYTEEQLKAIKVEFYSLDRDEDGYTVAYFNKVKE